MELTVYLSPMGPICIESDGEMITTLKFANIESGSAATSPLLKTCTEELEAYFNKSLDKFSVPIRLNGTVFQNKVWAELINIPYGTTISYSELAVRLGDIKCIRAAGTANGKNQLPIIVPCHRVIGKNGSMVGFAGGIGRKEWLLRHEGAIQGEQMKIFT